MPSNTSFLQCIHGDVHPYPIKEIQETVGDHIKTLYVGMATAPSYPVVLGQDWKYFSKVLQVRERDPAQEVDHDAETVGEAGLQNWLMQKCEKIQGKGPYNRPRKP